MAPNPFPRPGLPAAPAAPEALLPPPRPTLRTGISLRPSDAINPYKLGRLTPDKLGAKYLTVWCPRCESSLLVTALQMIPGRGLFIEGVCYTCSNPEGASPGIYRQFLMALPEGDLPSVT
jgi:hypothetical protein